MKNRIFLAALLGVALTGAALARGPVIELGFESGFDDEGPHRLKGVSHGDEVLRVPGRNGRALFVGGTSDWLDLELSSAVSFGGGLTLELWFKRDDWKNPYKGGSGWQTMASVTTDFSLAITAPGCPLHKPWALEGHVSGYREDVKERETARVLSEPYNINPGRWRHAALVYDPAGSVLRLYLDGKLTDTARGGPVPGYRIRKMSLGTWYKNNQAYRGAIDDVAVYDFPRSAEDIAAAAFLSQ